MRIAKYIFIFVTSTYCFADDSDASAWKRYAGQAGPSGWRCHVIHPDPHDDGPDGINLHDWNRDGHQDVFVNAEEGQYSRLYFNPGPKGIDSPWQDFIQLSHGPCEDSGIGDLDGDGDLDYVANGGHLFFNPGSDQVDNPQAWVKLTLFDYERRVPTVFDVDGDGLNDLIVGAQEWYKQPTTDKYRVGSWRKFTIGHNRWPMNCIMEDLDGDGDEDMIVPDRGVEICWYENPRRRLEEKPWVRRTLHSHTEPMFMAVADVNQDSRKDLVIAGGSKGTFARQLLILLRTNTTGLPTYHQVAIPQPCGEFPKGVAVADLDGDEAPEILVVPKSGNLWTVSLNANAQRRFPKANDPSITVKPLEIPGATTRKKMDNAWLSDLDNDGDLDVLTTEENGGWGVIWFENPLR